MSSNTTKSAFLLYLDQEEYFRRLSGDECRELILAIFQYERDQTEPIFSSTLVEMAFIAFKQSLDRNRRKHEHISQVRSEVGRKGAVAKHGKTGNCQQKVAKGGKAAESESESESNKEDNNVLFDDANTKQSKEKPARSASEAERDMFEKFRKKYPGTKRGLDTELKEFIKKHKDWREELPKLELALDKELEWRDKKQQAKEFCPKPKNLKTWLNNRCWEQEFPDDIGTNEEHGYPNIYGYPTRQKGGESQIYYNGKWVSKAFFDTLG